MLPLPSDSTQRNTAAQTNLSAVVAESTASKIRTFLYEIAEGTRNYRSLHSLTQQVEHQYHGRFLVELIQNAHDALLPDVGVDDGRIEIRLDPVDGAHGTLYVANDGSPFTESNFTSLSQLGQSDKNPQESIGNKGIGFRSVLEISDSPQIYSRRSRSSAVFDGLCFGFTPEVLSLLAAPMDALAQGAPVQSPFDNAPLVDWDEKLLAKYRRAVARHDLEWLATERSFLSPYLLPIPLSRTTDPAAVSQLEAAGFATVLRLPLKSPDALALVRRKMRELAGNTTLFLDRVRSLVLDDGDARRNLTRVARVNTDSPLGRQEIQITTDGDVGRECYWIWSRTIRVEESSAEFQGSLRELPGKWPELREARVSIALRVADHPEVGSFSVFLPTLLRTGSATHVNAPFFADMSRTTVDFELAYNRGLLDTACCLALDAVRSDLAGRDPTDAQMIVDLLAPLPDDPAAGNRWLEGITTCIRKISASALAEETWFLSTTDWAPLNQTSLFPLVPNPIVFTDATLREHATFGVFHACMNTRSRQLEKLSQTAGFTVHPRPQDLAETAEVVAHAIHTAGGADWNAFWSELRVLMMDNAELLKKRKILLGQDNALHSAGENCTVFFAPRRGVGEDDEFAGDDAIIEIPPTLQPHVAFLHDSIVLYDENNRQTPTRKFLDGELVKRFRVEDIFAEVLIPRTPKLPVRRRSRDAPLCADILRWGLRLLSNLMDRGIGDKTVHLLKNLAVPCTGGWYRAHTAAYGRGWPQSQGDTLERYLTGVGSEDCEEAANRLLLPPSRPEWGSRATRHVRLLNAAGVVDGLRLGAIEPGRWASTFYAGAGSFALPEQAPPGFPISLWEPYRLHARTNAVVYYVGSYFYQVEMLYTIPGMVHYDRLEGPTRRALMELILGSICQWQAGWSKVSCSKKSGSSSFVSIRSPLWFVLNQLQWLGFGPPEKTQWSSPTERWHVPAKVLGARTWQFDHLDPLPVGIAHRLDGNPALASVLADLGMPQYDLETLSGSVALLNALASANESDAIRDPNVFLGQVRSAWGAFAPTSGQAFPRKLLVQQEKRIVAVTPSAKQPIYIPDAARSFVSSLERFGVSVLAIEPADATRLAAALVAAYGKAVVLTSTLQVLAVADGEPWIEGEAQGLHDTALDWVIEVALTLAAYGGFQPRGTGSARFAGQVQAFREARVSWCTTLSARLNAADQFFEQDVPAMWVADRKTLLMADRCRDNPALLSEALAAILGRDDLTIPMMLALREIGDEPQAEAVIRALGTLRLTEAQLLEVREHWRGTLRHIIDLLMPLLTIVVPNVDHSALFAARSEEHVAEYLASLQVLDIDVNTLLTKTRLVTNIYDFGLACYRQYGRALQLDQWNSALRQLRERPLENSSAAAEFAAHASQAMPTLRSVLAAALRKQPAAESARTLMAALERIACPEHYPVSFWEVCFADVMAAVAEFFESIAAPADIIDLLKSSELHATLVDGMRRLGIDPAFDPAEAARKNRERLRASICQLQEIGLAWAVGIWGTIAALWESRVDRYMDALDANLATAGCLTLWTDEEVFALLRALPRDAESHSFWNTLDTCKDLEEVRSALGLSDERLVSARKDLVELRERVRRQNRLISVCGQEFDSSDDNLAALWSHIATGLPDDVIGSLDPITLAEPTTALVPPPKRKPSGQGVGGYRSIPSPKARDNLVGLAGEIHAFRRLQQQYGALIVSASSWLSSNALHAYADNTAVVNDAAGCDFRFVVEGKTYHIEVKSSSGADEMFTLGSSEIRLAMELSKSRSSRKRSVFVLLRVLDALSAQPTFQVLPNPYDGRFRSLYDIVEAGARVRYRIHFPEPPFEL